MQKLHCLHPPAVATQPAIPLSSSDIKNHVSQNWDKSLSWFLTSAYKVNMHKHKNSVLESLFKTRIHKSVKMHPVETSNRQLAAVDVLSVGCFKILKLLPKSQFKLALIQLFNMRRQHL